MIAVSFIKSKSSLLDTIKKIEDSKADYIHVDLMDGLYVENNNILEFLDILNATNKALDIHLMVNNPLKLIDKLILPNTKMITFHLDAEEEPIKTIEEIKKHNIKVGIAINPDDNIDVLDNYYDLIDYVLVMSVVPGKGGQEFIKDVLNKIEYLQNKNVLIGIDGGINDNSIKYLKDYKVDVIVSGSYICMSDDYNKQIENLENAIQ